MNEENLYKEEGLYEDDGVYGEISEEELKSLMDSRKIRYTDGYNKPIKSDKKFSRNTLIGVVIAVFVYYFTIMILNFVGTISSLTMFIMMAPVALAAVIFYAYMKRKS